MLLRSSRAAGALTKEALLGGAFKVGKGALGFAGRHWKGVGGAGLVGMVAAPEISKGVQKARVGMNPNYLQAANAGMVPPVPKM